MTSPNGEQVREALLDLQRAKEREARQREHAEALFDGLRALANADIDAPYETLLGVMVARLGATSACVLEGPDPQTGHFEVTATTDPSLAERPWPAQGPVARAASGAVAVVGDAAQVPALAALPPVARGDVRSCLLIGAAVRAESGRAILVCVHDASFHFGRSHTQLGRQLRPVLGEALERARARDRERALLAKTVEQNDALRSEIEVRLETERQLRAAQAGLVQAEKLSSLGRMVAGVAHELRNPVNYIGNNVLNAIERQATIQQTLRELIDQDDPESAELAGWLDARFGEMAVALGHAQDGAARAGAIVESLVNFARLDEATFKQVDLVEILESSLRILAAKWSDIVVDVDRPDAVPLRGHPVKLGQVLLNLLDNAMFAASTHNPRGSARVGVHFEVAEGRVRVRVSDNGPGVAPDFIDRLFEPFATTKPVGTGTGMGLAICWAIVQEHEGEITYAGDEHGACFELSLPTAGEGEPCSS